MATLGMGVTWMGVFKHVSQPAVVTLIYLAAVTVISVSLPLQSVRLWQCGCGHAEY